MTLINLFLDLQESRADLTPLLTPLSRADLTPLQGLKTGQPGNADDAYDLWNNAHTATLEDYGLKEGPGVLYHPSAIGGD